MTEKQVGSHLYKMDDTIYEFTNRGASGVTKNDGKLCKIIRLKSAEEWARDEPEYVIRFLDNSNSFGVRECEIKPITKKGV